MQGIKAAEKRRLINQQYKAVPIGLFFIDLWNSISIHTSTVTGRRLLRVGPNEKLF